MHAAEGILTTRGGMTSHAAVVARGMGKPCVSGAGSLRVDYAAGTVSVAGRTLRQGDVITIDGSTGQVLAGRVADDRAGAVGGVCDPDGVGRRAAQARCARQCGYAERCEIALRFGAEGIGLCRTEHMFFDEGRIRAMREMILARRRAVAPRRARQASAHAARRLRRAVRDHAGSAGDDPAARPAAARIPAAQRAGDLRGRRRE